ncbi:hypothetical protein Q9Q95_20980 [Sphingomonas sp. DG1-23]|uniref:hypothetical protein n=1 Tax=Sphingomonas sp. DG1-23 TaxID=3068316 RepID=UPI00273E18D8|nr:hypothetical protein [Sphingomonas sp. DG1-23]MDP5281413.1 hypothetical protein [Sphingomonas sp. DG1-23]
MFNLIVAGSGSHWEAAPLSFGVDRFKEYSHDGADAVDIARPETLTLLEQIPTLLAYEVGARGPRPRTVRYGRLHNLQRRGTRLLFDFDPDPNHAYLDQVELFARSEELGIEPFEQHRTHWAIKDGDIPLNFIATGTPEPHDRTIQQIANEYGEALRNGTAVQRRRLREELENTPPTIDKARFILSARRELIVTPEIMPILEIEPRSAEGRRALEAILARDANGAELPEDWNYSLAWFLDLYGSPTEAARCDEAVRHCETHLVSLGPADGNQPSPVEAVAYHLWRCARSPLLVGTLRRGIAMQLDRLAIRQHADGYWETDDDGAQRIGVRATALATLAFQRLGDDRYHDAISRAVAWLLAQRTPDAGFWVRHSGDEAEDLIGTAVTLEVIRRSQIANDVGHVLDQADAWLLGKQLELGEWHADPLEDDFTTAIILGYLVRPNDLLAQVDGFLLMARDFFRRAEELSLEGGANTRRLAAIATVHAVEMFLYGLFENRDDLGLSAFRENGAETLGPRDAMAQLQAALRRQGVLGDNQRLAHRDQISSLIGRRDNIIHRAHEISANELMRGLIDARRFIERYGRDLLQIDLLQ